MMVYFNLYKSFPLFGVDLKGGEQCNHVTGDLISSSSTVTTGLKKNLNSNATSGLPTSHVPKY